MRYASPGSSPSATPSLSNQHKNQTDMKTSELIEALQEQLAENGDLEVMTSSNYGDYHRTEQLNEIQEIEPCQPIKTAYSHTGLAYPSFDDIMEEDEDQGEIRRTETEMVLVLRYTRD